MPRDLPPEETYSDEVDIPNNVDAVEPKNLNKSIKDKNRSQNSKQPVSVKSNKKLDYGERMRNALKQSFA